MNKLVFVVVIAAASTLAPSTARAESTNKAAVLRWPGYIDTDLNFSESNWFTKSHTIVARFMLQYPRAYRGPIVTVSDESGGYEIGQADFREEVRLIKLVLRVGGTTTYFYGKLQAARWQHLAVVRRNAVYNGLPIGSHFEVYLNGQPLCAGIVLFGSCPTSVDFSGSGPAAPIGNVRIGRDIAARSGIKQFYGFVDDVAVFSKALNEAAIQALAAKSRLDGTENGLLRGWTFDATDPYGNALPGTLNHAPTLKQGASTTIVSGQRDDGDAFLLPLPHPFYAPALKLPFKSKQQWAIIQGWATTGSHNGTAAFSLDFHLVGPESPNKIVNFNNPDDPACGEPIYAAAAGDIVWTYDSGGYDEGDVPNNDFDGNNAVTVEQDAFSYATYMHTFTGSIQSSFPYVDLPPWGNPIAIVTGKQVATVGTRNSCHLHFGVGNSTASKDLDPVNGSPDLPYANYPVAFWNYEACDKQLGKDCSNPANWYSVAYGALVEGQYVRNP